MTTRFPPSIAELLTRLTKARMERRDHADDCLLWDYESDGGCPDCAKHDANVVRALVRYKVAAGEPS